jgi:hypothetical protein
MSDMKVDEQGRRYDDVRPEQLREGIRQRRNFSI